ncbi:response regulator [Candidatus Peregrinibacteria bacterium]|nr:response regulator [Candidatus Peregrinibacteria bacterium]
MGKRILIVDDDQLLTKLYEFEIELQDHDVEVVTIGDGVAAMESIDKNNPDLLLLDLRLPKADGFTILKHLHDRQYSFPVLVVTNYDKESYREMCKEFKSVHEYLVKNSIEIHQLVEKLEQYLGRE